MDCLSPLRLKPPPGRDGAQNGRGGIQSCLFWKDRIRDVPQSYIYLRATGKWCREKWQETQKFQRKLPRADHWLAGPFLSAVVQGTSPIRYPLGGLDGQAAGARGFCPPM